MKTVHVHRPHKQHHHVDPGSATTSGTDLPPRADTTIVHGVLGPIPVADMGQTLVHEHVTTADLTP